VGNAPVESVGGGSDLRLEFTAAVPMAVRRWALARWWSVPRREEAGLLLFIGVACSNS
jgi:hypothetical protein